MPERLTMSRRLSATATLAVMLVSVASSVAAAGPDESAPPGAADAPAAPCDPVGSSVPALSPMPSDGGAAAAASPGGTNQTTSSAAASPGLSPAPASAAVATTPCASDAQPLGVVVDVVARDLRFEPSTLVVPASGTSVIVLTDRGVLVHNLTIDALGIQVIASPGRSGQATLTDPPPGTYEFYCSVSGHRQAGMEGTITIQ